MNYKYKPNQQVKIIKTPVHGQETKNFKKGSIVTICSLTTCFGSEPYYVVHPDNGHIHPEHTFVAYRDNNHEEENIL